MNKDYKQIKLWQGLVVLISAALIIFLISPKVLSSFGLYGSLLAEWFMLVVALLLVMIFKGNLKALFPIKKPSPSGMFGTVLIWVGSFLIEITLILLLTIFFPQQILGVNAGLSSQMTDVSFIAALLIIAVTPAICEEVVFRGVFLNSLKPYKYKWAAILVSGCIFGIFHGNVFRFVPTAIGGVVMAYILLESGNMIYNCFFHFINNLLPVIILFSMSGVYEKLGVWGAENTLDMQGVSSGYAIMMSAGLYMMMSAAAPSCLYIGNYLLHSRTPGYRDKLFPSGKPGIVILLIVSTVGLLIGGLALLVLGIINLPNVILYK